ncbi:MAG: DUF4157 domain-containing protein, partial [Actinomycetota bacterium]|nr:DUF4157 domain-containing protein [Actinomycetota bacterium]
AERRIQQARAGGKPLPAPVRRPMETALSADLGGVRVHEGHESDALNRSMQSRAFTVGNDIFFARGEYSPGGPSGRHLLAHELVHTVQQGAAGPVRRAAEQVQRYVLLNGTDYTMGQGAKLESQEIAVGLGVAQFTRKTREKAAGAGTLDTVEKAAGKGVLNKTTDRQANNAALPQLKYGTNGTDAVAVEATAGEGRVFYATSAVIAKSNADLHKARAEAELTTVAGRILAPVNPANPAGGRLPLRAVKPGKSQAGGARVVVDRFGQAAECNQFIKNIIGDVSKRVAVFGAGAGHEAEVAEEKEPTRSIASFAANNAGDAQGLTQHLATTGTTSESHDQPLPANYKNMANKQARDIALGINAGAEAGVGEGYVITQGSPMPADPTLHFWLDSLDKKVAGAAMTSAEHDVLKHKWGYHYAGIVAKVGSDAVSLENYNRETQQQWALDDLFMEQIGAVVDLRNQLDTWANGGMTIPGNPKQRKDWISARRRELENLGATATAAQGRAAAAMKDVEEAMVGLELLPDRLWHFKMYGSAPGQSFHEQWEGTVDDAMTLRVRQSTQVARAEYGQRLTAAANALIAQKPSSVTRQKLTLVGMTDIPAVRDVEGSGELHNAFVTGQEMIAGAALSAMHDWAVDAAKAAKKPVNLVPGVPALAGRANYLTTLDTLIESWQPKGAIVRSSSRKLKTALIDYRQKIGVAGNLDA